MRLELSIPRYTLLLLPHPEDAGKEAEPVNVLTV